MEFRTDRAGLLLEQLASSVGYARERWQGMTDDEYFWKPAKGAWTNHPRDESAARVFGKGDWVSDFALPEPVPAPVTTIAWRLTHLLLGFSLRWEWTFGGKKMLFDDIEVPRTADEAQSRLWECVDRWRADIGALDDKSLDTIGLSQFPAGLDPQVPFIALVWWQNRELIHHAAEVSLLRDLYARR